MTDARLVKLDAATQKLTDAETIKEIKDVRDQVAALIDYAKNVGMARADVNEMQLVKVLAERKAGEWVAGIQRGQGARTDRGKLLPTLDRSLKLAEIPWSVAHRWQTIATLTEEEIRALAATCTDQGDDFSSTLVYNQARRTLGLGDPGPQTEAALWASALRHLDAAMDALAAIGTTDSASIWTEAADLREGVSEHCT